MASRVSYRINLNEVFNSAFSDKSTETKRALRKHVNSNRVKRDVGLAIINQIKANTGKGLDKNLQPFDPYSDAYKESDAFKIFGKTSKVNMKLSGGMLASMKAQATDRTVEVFFDNQFSNDKAHGHINGSNNLPKRDFLGLPRDQEKKIVKKAVLDAQNNSLDSLINDLVGDVASVTASAEVGGLGELGLVQDVDIDTILFGSFVE